MAAVLAGCGDDATADAAGTTIDAPAGDARAPDAPAIDAPMIDAPADASPVDGATADGADGGLVCPAGFADCDQNPANGCEATVSGDPRNCGSCGHSCGDTSCLTGMCQPRILFNAGFFCRGLAQCPNGDLYYTNYSYGVVGRAVPPAYTPQASVTNQISAFPVTCDGSYAAWANNDGTIRATPAASPGTTTTIATGQTNGQRSAFAIVLSGGRAYWTSSDGALRGAPVTGGNVDTLASGIGVLAGLATDDTYLYFAAGNTIRKIPLGGGNADILALGQSTPQHLAVDATAVYWVNAGIGGDGSVAKVDKSGGNVTVLATQEVTPFGVAVDDTFVFWTDQGGTPGSGYGMVREIPKNGGTKVTLAQDLFLPDTIVADGLFVYWILENGAVYRVAR